MKHECACVVRDNYYVIKEGAAFFELGLPVAIRRSAACVQPSITSTEGVPPLPAMIGLPLSILSSMSGHAGTSPSLWHSLRQGAVYGKLSLSLVTVPGPSNSLISVSLSTV